VVCWVVLLFGLCIIVGDFNLFGFVLVWFIGWILFGCVVIYFVSGLCV